MMEENLISVLVPVFNGSSTIKRCIDSVLMQTYSKLELILYDDGSEDDLGEIVEEYSDVRLKYYSSQDNVGIAKARNKLLDYAKGEFIAWIDADDYMLPTRLERQKDYLDSHSDVAVVGTSVFLRNYPIKERAFYPNSAFIHSFQFYKSCTLFPTMMTRNFYKDKNLYFKEELGSRASDFEWIYRVGKNLKIVNMDFPLTSYYVSSEEEHQRKLKEHGFYDKSIALLKGKFQLLELHPTKEELGVLFDFLMNNKSLKLWSFTILIFESSNDKIKPSICCPKLLPLII